MAFATLTVEGTGTLMTTGILREGRFLLATVLMPTALMAGVPAKQGDTVSFPGSYFERYHPNSASDMVQHLPGFTFNPGDPTLRGLAEAAGNVVVDGHRLADKDFSLQQVLNHIPADRVERIELVRGNANGIDMLGQPVVANVIRSHKPGTFGAVTVSDGVYMDARTVPAGTIEATHTFSGGQSVSGTLSLSRYVEVDKGDGRRVRRAPDGTIIETAEVHATSGGRTGYGQAAFETPLLSGQLRVDGSFTSTSYKDRQRDTTRGAAPVTSIFDEDLGGLGGGQANAEAGAHFSRSFGSSLSSETTLLLRRGWKTYTSVLSDAGSTTGFRESDRTWEILGHTQWRYQLSPTLSAELRGEAASNKLNTASILNSDGAPLPLPDADAVVTERRVDIGGDLTWQPTPAVQLTGGIHFERSTVKAASDDPQRHVYAFPKPVLRVVYQINPRQELRLRLEREVGQLGFSDFIAAAALDKGSVSAANAGISPQHDWVAEISYELRTRAGSALLITYGHSWLRDAVDWIPVPAQDGGPPSYDARGNIGSGREDKLTASFDAPLKGLGIPLSQLKIAATVDETRVRDPITGRMRGSSDLKPVQITVGYQQDVPRALMSWGISYASPWRTRTYRFNEIDLETAGSELDLYAEWHPSRRLSVRLDFTDVLRRRYGRVISTYEGIRSPVDLLYGDSRGLRSGPAATLKIRKSF